MESLRRLTSSVFEGAPVVRLRRHSVPDVAADARALDLTFITDRLLVSGFPVDGPTDKKLNQVNVDELAQYLEVHHRHQFMLFNLNALEDVMPAALTTKPPSPAVAAVTKHILAQQQNQVGNERPTAQRVESIASKLHEQMLEFGWERDGMKAHTPPLDLIFRICYAIFAWLSLDASHVAIVNCQTGKTRSGVVVACYLLFARLVDDPIDAFVEFYRKRWDMKSLTPQALRNKTPPSIQRFLTSFHELVEQQKLPSDKPLLLKAIMFRQLPVEVQPCVQIWDDYKLIFCTDSVQGGGGGNDAPVLEWNEDDGFFAILWENGIELDGGFSILCSFGEDYDNAEEMDASSRVLFRYADSTWFLLPGMVTLKKNQLDLMKQYEHGFDDELFSMDLVLHDNSAKKRRTSVRIDYTGNNAVRQGLIEITKHHMVLPDPAMHSNFIRMGFSETPTTFALQRSQNTPNVALDVLHLDGVSACFGQDNPESLSESKETSVKVPDPLTVSDAATNNRPPLLRRHTTAEIVAMQSQRTRYSIPTVANSSLCNICKEDDYMMRPQIVQCAGQCKQFYHTTCVGLRKIPFGLTTISDRTNHSIYVKKFFSSWECDACTGASAAASSALPGGQIPANMTLVPSAWVADGLVKPTLSSETALINSSANPQDVSAISSLTTVTSSTSQETQSLRAYSQIAAPSKEGAIAETSPMHAEHEKLDQLRAFLASSGISVDDLLRAATTRDVALPSPLEDTANKSAVEGNASGSSVAAALRAQDVSMNLQHAISERATVPNAVQNAAPTLASSDPSMEKYERMLKRGVPYEAVQNCMVKDGRDPSVLKPLPPQEHNENDQSISLKPTIMRLKDVDEYCPYFNMLRMGCPREAVRQKLAMDGVDPVILELGPDAIYAEVKHQITASLNHSKLQDDIKCVKPPRVEAASAESITESSPPLATSSPGSLSAAQQDSKAPAGDSVKLKDHEVYSKYFTMLKMGLPEGAVRHKMKKDGADERALDLGGDAPLSMLVIESRSSSDATTGDASVKLKNHELYSKYFKMLQMGLPEGAVRHKMKTDGADERALDLGGEALLSVLVVQSGHGDSDGKISVTEVKLKDHEVYGKYFKMLEMGLPEGAVRHKVVMDGADVRALVLGPEAPVSALIPTSDASSTASAEGGAAKKTTKTLRGRKKLHWQPISEDRLSSLNQQTIWEDKEEEMVELEMDMAELESLFFANKDNGAKKAGSRAGKPLKRKQSVTLIDGKRAMNAAISLARVKLSYEAIAAAVESFDRRGLTVQQLMGINEFLPTAEEVTTVTSYTGEVALLGEVCAGVCVLSTMCACD